MFDLVPHLLRSIPCVFLSEGEKCQPPAPDRFDPPRPVRPSSRSTFKPSWLSLNRFDLSRENPNVQSRVRIVNPVRPSYLLSQIGDISLSIL